MKSKIQCYVINYNLYFKKEKRKRKVTREIGRKVNKVMPSILRKNRQDLQHILWNMYQYTYIYIMKIIS